ncbi:MAG: hypothetical protein HUJ56_09710, partial [Erysipelotrichaceae bacterium]|nr:hypothetical protein [Erysipelotrichaceae bacterium]
MEKLRELSGVILYPSNNMSDLEAEQRTENKLKQLDKSGANAPVISENMIPIYFDEETDTWKKADKNNKINNYMWYNYDDKIWANSVTVTSTNRETYKEAEPGTEIPMSDILTMQTWI